MNPDTTLLYSLICITQIHIAIYNTQFVLIQIQHCCSLQYVSLRYNQSLYSFVCIYQSRYNSRIQQSTIIPQPVSVQNDTSLSVLLSLYSIQKQPARYRRYNYSNTVMSRDLILTNVFFGLMVIYCFQGTRHFAKKCKMQKLRKICLLVVF